LPPVKEFALDITAATTIDQGTAGDEIAPAPPAFTSTRPTIDVVTDKAGHLRSTVSLLGEDVEKTHQESYTLEWRMGTQRRGAASSQEILDELADTGFGWRDIARMVRVTVPAVQKWRRGEGTSGANRLLLASILAACDLIVKHYEVREIASWFEMPIIREVPLTPIDLWASGREDLVFEHASQHRDPESTLTAFDEHWRDRYHSDFEVYLEEDGLPAIRPKS
jgi:hypothetical protein